MIKVIDGKRYNTATAKKVHSVSHGFLGDFEYREKTLYRTPKGSWFLYHRGGAQTDMVTYVGGGYSGGEDIEPITEDEAFDFLQEVNGVEALEQYFGDRIQDA